MNTVRQNFLPPITELFPTDPTILNQFDTKHDHRIDHTERISYRTIDSPIGELLLVSSEQGLIRVGFKSERFDQVLEYLAKKISPRIFYAPKLLDIAAQEFDQYFTGTRATFTLALDHRLSSGFRSKVHRYLPTIRYGQTTTYRQIAYAVSNPKAVRAVGTACATNPIPIVVPCHRVLRTDGRAGGYRGGLEAKTILLDLEKVLHES